MRVSLACVAVAFLMTGCATAEAPGDEVVTPAVFTDAPSNATRELIRRYVYDTLGTNYIVDIDALMSSDRLIARDRGREVASGQPMIAPDVEFRLERIGSDDDHLCRLVPQDDQVDADPLMLPADTTCQDVTEEL